MIWLLLACPEPVAPTAQEGCLTSGCHGAVEQIHYGGPALRCVDCHLGDPDATTKEAAHVTVDVSFNPSSPGATRLERPSLRALGELPDDVIRFLNPSDYRVALATCGTGVTCHEQITQGSLLLNRATLSGQLTGGLYVAGLGDGEAAYAVVDAVDPHTPAEVAPEHVSALRQLPTSPPDGADPVARAFFPVYEQLCVECHLYQDGPKVPGLYYVSGCSGCHLVTDDDARAKTADATQDREERGHPATHRFTNLVPDRQCAHCHTSHLGRSLLARGVRERSEPEGDASIGGPNRGVEDPEHAVPWGEENYVRFNGQLVAYGKPYPFYVADEDGTNAVDETPPDVHTAAGMGCIDCHDIREAHGAGTMAIRMDSELDVRCASCHGRPGALATLTTDAGLDFRQSQTSVGGDGANTPVFERSAEGAVLQLVRFTGALHPVTQIATRADPASAAHNPRTLMGCALHAGTAETRRALVAAVDATDPAEVDEAFPGLPEGFVFGVPPADADGRVECFACHNTWTTNCYGCHMVRDDRQTYTSQLTGEVKPGKVQSLGLSVVADSLALGRNAAGRITPMVGTSLFFTHVTADGTKAVDAAPLTDGSGVSGAGNVHNPVHHHTVQRLPRDCQGCHPADAADPAALLTATGLGSGRYTFVDGQGAVHRLDQQLLADVDGDGATDPISGVPARVFAVTPAASSTHDPLSGVAGPLDADAVNRMLQNRVVPQRSAP